MKRRVVLSLCVLAAACVVPPEASWETAPAEGLTEEAVPTWQVPLYRTGWVPPLEPPPPGCEAELVFDPPAQSSVGEVRQLLIGLSVTGAEAQSELALEWVAPAGIVFQRAAQRLSGSPFDEQRASFGMPVAGTAIDSNSLWGTWTVRCQLNGVELATRHFELTP
ncbi:MAG: hypothetical protein ACOZIN_20975 [Myxococcota bacterium]